MASQNPAQLAEQELPIKKTGCPDHVWQAIYGKGKTGSKKEDYEQSLRNWWTEYADRKNDEEDEHVADSLLYDRNHLPRTAPAPECVRTGSMPQQEAQKQRQPQQQQ